MAFSAANIGGVADPRLDSVDADDIGTHRDSIIHEHIPGSHHGIAPPDTHGHNTIYLDNSITFEDYHYWANRSREFEKHLSTNYGLTGLLSVIGIGKQKANAELPSDSPEIKHAGDPKDDSDPDSSRKGSTEKSGGLTDAQPSTGGTKYGVTEAEWETAQRAGRTATWGAIFYLITTDILGPYSVPWAIAQLGYGPGITIFVVFGVLALYGGILLWIMFKGLDSPRYPIRNYGDVAFRLFGNWARIIANVLQSFQFFLNVGLCIVANGQSLSQMAAGKNQKGFLCFVVAQLVFTLIGFLLGQIRTLARLGWLANLAVWLNVTIMISSMYAVYKFPPNYAAFQTTASAAAPIVSSAGLPPGKPLYDNVNGVFNGVFAFGGATLFYELMAEMRRPHDFWKSLLIAEIFITCVYMIYGLIFFSRQGQYTYPVSFQGVSPTAYGLQTLGNALYFTVSVIAALLYGNIGIKVLYAAVLRDVFKFPPLESKKGKWTWVAMVPIYWSLAFVLAAAVPQIQNLTAFEGALTIMQFSYTFPPLFIVAYNCHKDAMLPEEVFDPQTGQTNYVDRGVKRYWRGFKKRLLRNSWDTLYFLAALATAILGIWASLVAIVDDFKKVTNHSFTCQNPAGA